MEIFAQVEMHIELLKAKLLHLGINSWILYIFCTFSALQSTNPLFIL